MEINDTSSRKIKLEEKLNRLEKFVSDFPCENPTTSYMTRLLFITQIIRQLKISAFSFSRRTHFPVTEIAIPSELNIPIKKIAEKEIAKIKTELELLPIEDERTKKNRRIIINIKKFSKIRKEITEAIHDFKSSFLYEHKYYVPDFLKDIFIYDSRIAFFVIQAELDSFSFKKTSKNTSNPSNKEIELIADLSLQLDDIKCIINDLTNGNHYISHLPGKLSRLMQQSAEEELAKVDKILSQYSISKE